MLDLVVVRISASMIQSSMSAAFTFPIFKQREEMSSTKPIHERGGLAAVCTRSVRGARNVQTKSTGA